MQIIYKSELTRQNEEDQTVYFTLTDDQDISYEFHADIPKDVIDIQSHLEANMRWYLRCIRLKEYPEADYKSFIPEDGDELDGIEAWIRNGCVNKIQTGEDEKGNPIYEEVKVEKVPWKSTHPPKQRIIDGEKLSEVTKNQLKEASTLKELKAVLTDIFIGRRDAAS